MRKIEIIVIHCSATKTTIDVTAADIDKAHKARGFKCWGYHYYIRKNGDIELMRPIEQVGAHVKGYNANSVAVCYEGGLDGDGRAADTRTMQQKLSMHMLVHWLWCCYPKARVVGHRDLSPDLNHNGRIEPKERIKQCPCFDAIPEMEHFRPTECAVREPPRKALRFSEISFI